jgi:iron-sulfur cluster assembly protein
MGTLDFRGSIARAITARTLRRLTLGERRDNLASKMITVTDSAVRQLRALLEERADASGKGLRVQIAKGGCSGLQYEMSLDSRQPGDQVVAQDGVEFFVDDESANLLRGATLDYHDGLTGAGFQIVNPNAARTCGCGSSFEPARPV